MYTIPAISQERVQDSKPGGRSTTRWLSSQALQPWSPSQQRRRLGSNPSYRPRPGRIYNCDEDREEELRKIRNQAGSESLVIYIHVSIVNIVQ